MGEMIAYHVVTDKPMQLGQHIVFDATHHSGVYQRVYEKRDIVKDIYSHTEKYDAETLEHHTRVALRELALEKVRVQKYPYYPSRLGCLYVSKSIDEAKKWADLFVRLGRPTYSIVKLKIVGNIFEGDANNCFDTTLYESENLLLAERYWKNLPSQQNEKPIKEILVDGDIEVMEIAKEINANAGGTSGNV